MLLFHLPVFQLPLSSISPFDINSKWNPLWWSYAWCFGEWITPNFYLRYSKASLGRGLVKMYAIYSFVSTYSNMIFFSVTCSLRKWNLMGMCLVLECITRFLDMFITLVLSQNHTLLVCLPMFASSWWLVYNMLLLQYILLLLLTRILKVVSCLTKILDSLLSRVLLHLYFFYHQCFFPGLHLCTQPGLIHFISDTKFQTLLCPWDT